MTDYEIEYQNNISACGAPFLEVISFFNDYQKSNASILDLGCGQGRDAILIAKNGHRVHGVDQSPTGIAQMLSRSDKENLLITGEVADLRNYQPKGEYDVVLLDRVIHMFENAIEKESILEKAKKATAKGGFMLIVDIPSNLSIIEASFTDSKIWQSVFRRKGYRFYRKIT